MPSSWNFISSTISLTRFTFVSRDFKVATCSFRISAPSNNYMYGLRAHVPRFSSLCTKSFRIQHIKQQSYRGSHLTEALLPQFFFGAPRRNIHIYISYIKEDFGFIAVYLRPYGPSELSSHARPVKRCLQGRQGPQRDAMQSGDLYKSVVVRVDDGKPTIDSRNWLI